MLPVDMQDMSTFISRRTLANEFQDIDQSTLSKMGIVKPWWMAYYGQATTATNKAEFANLANLYFGQQLKGSNALPCDVTIPQMKAAQEKIWNSATGHSMMATMRELTLDKMAGGRPAPLKDWSFYMSAGTAQKYAVAFSAMLTSPQMVQLLGELDTTTSAEMMKMSGQVLYALNARFLPTQTQGASADTAISTTAKVSDVNSGIATANGVTLSVIQGMQRAAGAYVATTIQFKAATTDESYTQIANLAIAQAKSGDDDMKNLITKLEGVAGGAVKLPGMLTDAAKACFKGGCGVSGWFKQAKIISPEWDSSTSLMSFKRLGQYMAVGSFFMDLAPVFEGKPLTPVQELKVAQGAIQSLAGAKSLIEDVAAKLLKPAFEELTSSLVSSSSQVVSFAGKTVEELGAWAGKAVSSVLSNAKMVANVLSCALDVVTVVIDIISAVKDFQSGQIVAGVSMVVGATSAVIALGATALAMVGVEVPFLAPLAIGVAIVGIIVGLFQPPPPPPPTGSQQVCISLKDQGLCSSVAPAPPPANFNSYVWSTTAFTGVVPGKTTCFQFTPTNDLKSLGSSAFGTALHDGPCTDLGYFTMATKCLLMGGSNTPYDGTFPSAPAPPPNQVGLSYELAGVSYHIWMKPEVQNPPGLLLPGRRLLGGAPAPDQRGSTVMYMYYGSGSTVCGQFTVPYSVAGVGSHFQTNQYFNVGSCLDHGFYTLLSKDGKAMTETFTSGWGQGTQYQVWVKNAVCGNIPDYTPNFYGI